MPLCSQPLFDPPGRAVLCSAASKLCCRDSPRQASLQESAKWKIKARKLPLFPTLLPCLTLCVLPCRHRKASLAAPAQRGAPSAAAGRGSTEQAPGHGRVPSYRKLGPLFLLQETKEMKDELEARPAYPLFFIHPLPAVIYSRAGSAGACL